MSNLGRYLGVPILHGRVTKHTFKFILDHLDNKLAGWKANNLSLAGRVTLASSVLSSIPSYVMQTAFLPVSLCDQIDKKIRSFIWGSTDASRKIHNVNWQTVCKPKSLGGLGLRSARDLNRAFLMKIVWGLISRPNDLWASVMATKYFNKESRGFSLKRRKGMTPPCPNAGDDILVWGLEDNGRFSVKSAYALIKDLRLDDSNGGWQKIWRWQGPNKIKHFMWIVAQGSLMTNAKRERRHIATSNLGSDFSSWWLDNISNQKYYPLFGITAWLLWKRRNKVIFDNANWSVEEVKSQAKFWVTLLSLSWKAGQLGREAPGLAR
ncbi:Putative ribonuclease H protein At1g65750 [Linum perenne]